MPLTIVVGGQFGSEGKGKVAHFFTKYKKAKAVIRCGGVNSGHSIRDTHGRLHVFKQLPTAALIKGATSVLVPGSYIDLKTLQQEAVLGEESGSHLLVDPRAVVMTEEQTRREAHSSRGQIIGSTGFGMAEALTDRISRSGNTTFAEEVPSLKKYLVDTSEYLRETLDRGDNVILEGTQGFGLSLLHSDFYPYVTSRDTTAAGFLSEAGLSPFDVDDIVMVLRSYPIRVGGNSGPLKNEITWEEVSRRSSKLLPIKELTTVTQRVRRVAEFDSVQVKKAIRINKPTRLVLNHVDYIPEAARTAFVREIEKAIGMTIEWFGLDDMSLYNDYLRKHAVSA